MWPHVTLNVTNMDNMDSDGSVRTLSRFVQIYDSGREHGFIDRFREWFRDKQKLS
jgi:hypothetical protein